MVFKANANNSKRWKKLLLVIVLIMIFLAGAAMVGARIWYDSNLRPVSSESRIVVIEIPIDSSLDDIAVILHGKSLIRNETAFKIYVRNREYTDLLRAGVYDFDTSMSVQQIVEILVNGTEAKDLVTIPPGLRLDQVKSRLMNDGGFSSEEVDAGLSAQQYASHPSLVSKPRDATLEGYLYPESFQVTSSSTVKEIITQSLDQMALRLTPERLKAFTRQGLTAHEAIIMASVIEREVHQPEDRRIVAQIFLKRYREGIPLGADATYVYAAEITGQEPHPDLDSPYNTRKYPGLPPGPISNVGETSLDAVASPADTNFLFFVSGDDGKNYFANTQAEHEKNIELHCQQNCGN